MNRLLGFPTVLTRKEDLGAPNVSLLVSTRSANPSTTRRIVTTPLCTSPITWHGPWRHQFKFGADVRLIQVNNYLDFLARANGFSKVAGAEIRWSPWRSWCRACPTMPSRQGDTFNSLRSTGMSYYAQDDIRLAPRLLLSLGLRYEYNAPPVEAHDRFSVPDLSARSMACSPYPTANSYERAPTHSPCYLRQDLNNVAPRIGVAWRPLRTERFVSAPLTASSMTWES